MPDPAEIDDRIDRATARPFGRRFHLRGRERATAELRGPQTMRAHAAEIIAERLSPGRAAQRRPADPLPQPPGLRGPARHRDLLPQLPGDVARHREGHRLDRGERAYVVE